MPDSKKIEVLIQSILDAKGFDELKNKLEQSHSQSQDSAAAFKSAFGEIAAAAAAVGVSFEALKTASDFLWDSFKEAIEAEKVFYSLENAVRSLADGDDAAVKSSKEFIENLETSSGIVKEELVPAYERLLAKTHEVAGSQDILTIAAGAATRNLGESVDHNVSILMRFMETGKVASRETSVFGTELRKAAKGGGDLGDIMARLPEQWRDGGAAVDTAAQQVARNKVAWEQTKAAIGDTMIQFTQYLRPAMEAGSVVIVAGITVVKSLGDAFVNLANEVIAAGKAVLQVSQFNFTGAFKTMQDAGKVASERIKATWSDGQALADQVMDRWEKTATGVNASTDSIIKHLHGVKVGHEDGAAAAKKAEEATLAAYKIQADVIEGTVKDEIEKLNQLYALEIKMSDDPKLNPAHRAEALKNAAKIQEEITKKTADADKKAFDAREAQALIEITRIASDEKKKEELINTHNKQLLQNEKLTDEERKKLEKEVADYELRVRTDEAAADLKAAQKLDADKKKIIDGALGYIKKSEKQVLQERIAEYEADLKAFTWTAEEKAKIEQALHDMKKDLGNQELKQAATIAGQMGQVAQSVFGDSKEGAIAQAIINVIQGVTEAIAQGGIAGIATGAVVLASGMAEVKKIEGTDYKSKAAGITSAGFDDPMNDAAAQLGGAKWANDFIGKFSDGAGGVAAQHRNQPSTIYNNTVNHPGQTVHSTVANFNGALPMIDSSRHHIMLDFARQMKTYFKLIEQQETK